MIYLFVQDSSTFAFGDKNTKTTPVSIIHPILLPGREEALKAGIFGRFATEYTCFWWKNAFPREGATGDLMSGYRWYSCAV
jgi:hypothetical protein